MDIFDRIFSANHSCNLTGCIPKSPENKYLYENLHTGVHSNTIENYQSGYNPNVHQTDETIISNNKKKKHQQCTVAFTWRKPNI
jgi:hypothetical protein